LKHKLEPEQLLPETPLLYPPPFYTEEDRGEAISAP